MPGCQTTFDIPSVRTWECSLRSTSWASRPKTILNVLEQTDRELEND
jgi:hypothetical protein